MLLIQLVNRLCEEEKTGFANKETILQIAEYFANHTLKEVNTNSCVTQAYDKLVFYRTYKLIQTNRERALFNIENERQKQYQKRCSNCGLAITTKKHLCKK